MARTFLGIWTWLAFGTISFVGFFCCLTIFLLTFPFDQNRVLTGRAIRYTGRLMCAAGPAWRFSIQEPAPRSLPARSVCVSNHCSNIDPFLLTHLPFEVKFIAKAVLFRIPCVGWGMAIAGDISLVRGSTQSVKKAMDKARRYLRQGMPVLIFPEGTRSKTPELLPFKDGAFRLAIESGACIVPIAVAGTRNALKTGDWRPGVSRGTSLIGTPISTEGMSLSDLKNLKEKTRLAIEDLRLRLSERGYEP